MTWKVQKQSSVVLPIEMTSMFTSIMFYITTKCINDDIDVHINYVLYYYKVY